MHTHTHPPHTHLFILLQNKKKMLKKNVTFEDVNEGVVINNT